MKLIQAIVMGSVMAISSVGMSALPGGKDINSEVQTPVGVIATKDSCRVVDSNKQRFIECDIEQINQLIEKKMAADPFLDGNNINGDGGVSSDGSNSGPFMNKANLYISVDPLGYPEGENPGEELIN